MKFVIAAAAVAAVYAADEAPAKTCLEGIKIVMYKDDKCKEVAEMKDKDGKKVEFQKVPAAQLDALNSKCNKVDAADIGASPKKLMTGDYKSMTTTCDKTGMKNSLFTDAECKEGKVESTLTWGDCKTLTVGTGDDKITTYYKVTGAAALQATAAIALAYVGAQF